MSDTEEKKTQDNPEENQDQPTQEEQTLEESPKKDRTAEQFDKLKDANRDLKTERDGYKSILDSLLPEDDAQTPQPTPQQPAPVQAPSADQFSHLEQDDIDTIFKDMINDEGLLDGNKLLDTLKSLNGQKREAMKVAQEANERVKRVEEHVKREQSARERSIKDEKTRELHEKYPMLDPESDSFDPEYHEAVRNDIVGQYMSGIAPGDEDPIASADKLAKRYIVNKEEQQQQDKGQEARAHINASRPRSRITKGYYEKDEEADLVNKVRSGKKGALAELLRRRGQ